MDTNLDVFDNEQINILMLPEISAICVLGLYIAMSPDAWTAEKEFSGRWDDERQK